MQIYLSLALAMEPDNRDLVYMMDHLCQHTTRIKRSTRIDFVKLRLDNLVEASAVSIMYCMPLVRPEQSVYLHSSFRFTGRLSFIVNVQMMLFPKCLPRRQDFFSRSNLHRDRTSMDTIATSRLECGQDADLTPVQYEEF